MACCAEGFFGIALLVNLVLLILGTVLVSAYLGWRWLRRRPHADPPPASIVAFLQAPLVLNTDILAKQFAKASGRAIQALDMDNIPAEKQHEPADDMVVGKSPHFLATINEVTFVIHNVPAPYMPNPAAASDDFPELRVRNAIARHTAWLSIDVLSPDTKSPETYLIIGKTLAGLIGSSCLALYHPASERFRPYGDDETLEKLRSDDPVEAVFGKISIAPVIGVNDDPRMEAAEAEARNGFAAFVAAFENGDGSMFSIKAPITRGDEVEHIWVEVDSITPDRVIGALANDPVDLQGLQLGSKVEVMVSEIEDWAYERDGKLIGGFTSAVLNQIAEEQSR
jgi:uncharacterized protein YegJ (DUF2314 family)